MKKIKTLLLLIVITTTSYAQLAVGDIAIIGFNEDSGPGPGKDHSFTWIALTDIPANQEIYFSEEGWNNALNDTSLGFWGGSEGHIKWTAPAGGLSCGTIVHIYESGSDVFTVDGGGTISGVLAGASWNLIAGDQVLVYTSATGARPANTVPNFITAFHMNDNRENGGNHNDTTGWSLIASGGSTSHVPPGLTNGVNCMAIHAPTPVSDNEVDNVKYTGTLTGTSSDLLATIYNLADKNTNWYRHNSIPADITPSGYSPNVTCTTLSSSDYFINNKIVVFPSPSSEFIEIAGLTKVEHYEIFNAIGQIIKRGRAAENEKIDIQNLKNGVYFLKLENGNTLKFIRE